MYLDFSGILVIASFVTGLIWGIDVWVWAPARRERAGEGGEPDEPIIIEYARSFFPIIVIVLILRSFVFEPFRIPSGSMMPSLLVGDFILVNKYTYGLRLPMVNKKIIDMDEPKRGDVIVFRYPGDTSVDYIKRVVGLPGDRVAYLNKTLYINGIEVPQGSSLEYVGEPASLVKRYTEIRAEKLDEHEYHTLVQPNTAGLEGQFLVPDGYYFVMGDNRDNSNDSRRWGFVPEVNLIGRAFMIWMSWDSRNFGVRWERLGSSIP
ncbi:MAG: signal peptidase I [Gammaproteobacteria bacterium]|nr:MAG: signal peptidase I [Gammaproteobacteria bacterium]